MIELKYYREKEGRDCNKYLGLDNNPIPIHLFKGVFSEKGNVYAKDEYGDAQFVVSDDEQFMNLVGVSDDAYVALEDIQSNDYWLKVGHILSEYSNIVEISNQKDDKHERLLQRYLSGETGLLEFEEKSFNNKGEYMRVRQSFDTRPTSQHTDVRSTLLRHVAFVYHDEPTLRWEERNIEVRGNFKNIAEVTTLLIGPVTDLITTEMLKSTPGCEFSFKLTGVPPFGNMELIVDESVEDFLVRKKETLL